MSDSKSGTALAVLSITNCYERESVTDFEYLAVEPRDVGLAS
jgi:hypothetical protein